MTKILDGVSTSPSLVTANNFTLKQDASGNLGIYNSSGVETAYFDSNGNIIFVTATATPSNTLSFISGYGNVSGDITINMKSGGVFYLKGPNNFILYAIPQGISIFAPIIILNGVATAGLGVTGIYAVYSQIAKNAAVTNAINYMPPASTGTYRLTWIADVNASVTHNFVVIATWKDASGNATSQTLGGSDKNGSALVAGAITNVLGTGVYYGSVLIQIDNSATAITLSTVGTFTSVTYNLACTLEQLA